MTTQYARGAAFERRVRAALEKQGYQVIRSAGSRGAADLWAAKPGELLLVQCKRDGRLSKAAEQALVAMAEASGATAVLAEPGSNGRGVFFRVWEEKCDA